MLALQGGVAEHLRMLESLGADARKVRHPADLEGLDALVLPGGESSTIDRLTRTFGLREPLIDFARAGHPVLGTCAGLILLARTIRDPAPGQRSLGLLDAAVARNAFGPQTSSAEALLTWGGSARPEGTVRAAFIRAPEVVEHGPDVEVLARFEGRVVAVRQGRVLGISFHPELTGDTTVHRELLGLIPD
ncbi:5'-phosphate synthase pdxT subunit [Kocuria sp. AG109]|nr:5'-phosphate synthase pdxT subunit [Kocuria sp. AG109]